MKESAIHVFCHLFAAYHKEYMCLFLICRQVGTNLVIPGGARTIEARGKLVMPGKQANRIENQVTVNFLVCKLMQLMLKITMYFHQLSTSITLRKEYFLHVYLRQIISIIFHDEISTRE